MSHAEMVHRPGYAHAQNPVLQEEVMTVQESHKRHRLVRRNFVQYMGHGQPGTHGEAAAPRVVLVCRGEIDHVRHPIRDVMAIPVLGTRETTKYVSLISAMMVVGPPGKLGALAAERVETVYGQGQGHVTIRCHLFKESIVKEIPFK